MTALRQEDDAPRGFVTKAEHYAALREIDRLQDELAAYRETLGACVDEHRVAVVQGLLKVAGRSKRGTRYASLQMARVLLQMADHGSISRAQYALHIRSEAEDLDRLVTVLICYLRRQLNRLGAPPKAIVSNFGIGYSMTPEARQWLRERAPEAFQNGGRP